MLKFWLTYVSDELQSLIWVSWSVDIHDAPQSPDIQNFRVWQDSTVFESFKVSLKMGFKHPGNAVSQFTPLGSLVKFNSCEQYVSGIGKHPVSGMGHHNRPD